MVAVNDAQASEGLCPSAQAVRSLYHVGSAHCALPAAANAQASEGLCPSAQAVRLLYHVIDARRAAMVAVNDAQASEGASPFRLGRAFIIPYQNVIAPQDTKI